MFVFRLYLKVKVVMVTKVILLLMISHFQPAPHPAASFPQMLNHLDVTLNLAIAIGDLGFPSAATDGRGKVVNKLHKQRLGLNLITL